jgi:hypothetical protein
MRLKFRSPSERLKVIQDTIPEGKFIAFFGTSHTSGSCVRDGMGEQIDLSRIWAQQVADHMGLPLFNASNPGIDNDIMIQMMLDFLDLPESDRCVRVISEIRVAEGTFRLGRDMFNGFTEYRRKEFVPQLTNCFEIPAPEVKAKDGDVTGHITVGDRLMARVPINYNRIDNQSLKDMALNSVIQGGSDVPREYVHDVVSEIVEVVEKYIAPTMSPFIEDFYKIRTMRHLCKLKGIPFNWFCWDTHSQFYDPSTEYRVVKDAFSQVTDIFKVQIKCFDKGAKYSFKEYWEDNLGNDWGQVNCECGHQTEEMHDYVAKKIIKELEL